MPKTQTDNRNRIKSLSFIKPGDILVQCMYHNKDRELVEVLSVEPKYDCGRTSIPCIKISLLRIQLVELDLYAWGLIPNSEGFFVSFEWLEKPTGWKKFWWRIHKFFSKSLNPPKEGYIDEGTIIKYVGFQAP